MAVASENRILDPYCKNDKSRSQRTSDSGWFMNLNPNNGIVGDRVAVTGVPRGYAFSQTAGSDYLAGSCDLPVAKVSPGETITYSYYVKLPSTSNIGLQNRQVRFTANPGEGVGRSNPSNVITTISAPAQTNLGGNVWRRLSFTFTVPSNSNIQYAHMFDENANARAGTYQWTCVLAEPGTTLNDYADGDTEGWSWNGTDGESTSSPPPPLVEKSDIDTATLTETASIEIDAGGIPESTGTKRLYLNGNNGDITPIPQGDWTVTSYSQVHALGNKSGGLSNWLFYDTLSTNPNNILTGQYVSSPALNDGILGGTVSWVSEYLQGNNAMNGVSRAFIYVIKPDGSVRGTLLPETLGSALVNTAATGVGALNVPLSYLVVHTGDRIVVELGLQAQNSSSTSYAARAFTGGTGSDLVLNQSASGDSPGWVEFSNAADLFEVHNVFVTGQDEANLEENTQLETSTTVDEILSLEEEVQLFASFIGSDSAALNEVAQVLQLQYVNDSDQASFEDSITALSASMLITETYHLTEIPNLFVQAISTDSASLEEQAQVNITVEDGLALEETAQAARIIYASDSFELEDTAQLLGNIKDTDQASFVDFLREIKNAPPIFEDLIDYSRFSRTTAKSRKRYRVIAQSILTKEFVHMDLPLSDPQLGFKLSAPNSFKATLNTEIKSLEDLSPGLVPGNTWLHVEESNTIRQSTILQPFVDSTGDQKRQIEGVGFSDYANQRYYQGDSWQQIQIDPADIIRYLWNYIQGETGMSLGVTVSPDVVTPVRLGTPIKNVDFQTSDGDNVSFDAGPYDLNFWEVTNIGTEFNKLCKQTPIEYVERSEWNGNRTDVCHYIDLGYPRVGRKRTDLFFREGENLDKVIPEYSDTPENFPSAVIIIGAGEGPTAIRGIATQNTGRIPYEIVLENEDITNPGRATDLARFELKRRTKSRYQVKSIDVDTTHINALWGTFIQGDDILVEGKVRYVGKISDYHRITEYTYSPRTRIANLSLSPSASFSYGATPELEQQGGTG